MKKTMKKLSLCFLVMTMMISSFIMTPVKASETPVFQEDKTYALVSTTLHKALKATGVSWQEDGALFFDSDIEGNKVVEKAAFRIMKEGDYYVFKNEANAAHLKCETGISFVFNLETGTGNNFQYRLESVDGGYKIYSLGGESYLGLGPNNRLEKVSESQAEIFTFEEVGVLNELVYVKHVASGLYIKSYDENDKPLTVDGLKEDVGCAYHVVYGDGVVNFISKDYKKGWASAKWADSEGLVRVNQTTSASGWESIIFVPNGDGTISFKDCEDNRYLTVNDQKNLTNVGTESLTSDNLTDNEKFEIVTELVPTKVENITMVDNSLEGRQVGITWDELKGSLYSGYELERKVGSDGIYEMIYSGADHTYLDKSLDLGTTYTYRVRAFLNKDKVYSVYSDEYTITSLAGERPITPTGLTIKEKDSTTLQLNWNPVENAEKYEIYEAVSAYATYHKVDEVTDTTYLANYTKTDKYTKYYKIKAVNAYGSSALTVERISLETALFGANTFIFANTDRVEDIDNILLKLYEQQHDSASDAQFKSDHYQVYFKPGDYTETSCMYLGFYTAINGLGKTPYDVELNNIAIPDYLGGNNATCNFWRSVENISIINTGNEQGKAQEGSWRADWFNWAVAQAAPLRRVYSQRPVAYDWNYGWASGGYVADCLLAGVDGEGNSAGTWSGQQFYTRNSILSGNAFGTTLNNFFQGVIAPNLPTSEEEGWQALVNGNGYSNWNIADDSGNQQVFTTINETDKIAEKPFLYLDNGEYYVFVPDVVENTKGTSWSKDDMGKGTSIPLSEFYVANPTDSAATINEQIDAGKHIYFTPGIYHANTPIEVDREGTIVLGTGLATIIPDNNVAAMKIADKDGIRIAGLIFDAGEYSQYLLVVGDEDSQANHSHNPTVLTDLFFRVGGTTDVLTKADNALVINSDDVLCDHFWIWRADHGAGVAWDGNESKHGLIVNGDNVICYALFNEHFQNYHTLWNGDNGATYFYQNETAYDPISQEAWMSHNGTVNGYSSYKVSNKVKNHYAVGLGIYNVFIYTGESYDATEVQIQLDNAIEVPNAKGVLVENACTQTFANEDGAYQIINNIINGVGGSVSSGIDKDDSTIVGEGWSRKFLISYQDGTAIVGKETDGSDSQKGKYLGVDTIENVKALGDDDLDVETLNNLIDKKDTLTLDIYTPISVEKLEKALEKAKQINTKESLKYILEDEFNQTLKELQEAYDNLELKANKEDLEQLVNKEIETKEYTQESYQAYLDALKQAKDILDDENATQQDVNNAYEQLNQAIDNLKVIEKDPIIVPDEKEDPIITPNDKDEVKTGDTNLINNYLVLTTLSLGLFICLKKRKEHI